jgi:hypothetical protein
MRGGGATRSLAVGALGLTCLLGLIGLRSLPWIVESRRPAPVVHTPSGKPIAFVGAAYIPKDFAAYFAFVEQTRREGVFRLENPFTTDAQDGRFLLLFQWLAGRVARSFDWSTPAAWEAMRVPTGLLLGWALWRWLADVGLSGRRRIYAWVLALTASGLEWIGGVLPDPFPRWTGRFFWDMYGWSTFASLYNPMWVFCLALALLAQRAVRRWIAVEGSAWNLAAIVAIHLILLLTHAYSFLFSFAAIATTCVLVALAPERRDRRLVGLGATLGVLAAVAAGVGRWQAADPAFEAGARQALVETQGLPFVLWPIGFGVVCWGAWRGAVARGWLARTVPAADEPWRAWVATQMWLGIFPWLSGYKFLYLAHAPIAALAAAGIFHDADRLRRPRLPALLLAVAAIGSVMTTVRALREPMAHPEIHYMLAADRDALDRIAALPPGGLLASPFLAQHAPWIAARHVYAGHWFLTPDYAARRALVERFYRGDDAAGWKRDFLARARVAYVLYGATDPKPDAALRAALGLEPAVAAADGTAIAYALRPEERAAATQ